MNRPPLVGVRSRYVDTFAAAPGAAQQAQQSAADVLGLGVAARPLAQPMAFFVPPPLPGAQVQEVQAAESPAVLPSMQGEWATVAL
jgi:hypothetical protein